MNAPEIVNVKVKKQRQLPFQKTQLGALVWNSRRTLGVQKAPARKGEHVSSSREACIGREYANALVARILAQLLHNQGVPTALQATCTTGCLVLAAFRSTAGMCRTRSTIT